jgi:hypothetical protein
VYRRSKSRAEPSHLATSICIEVCIDNQLQGRLEKRADIERVRIVKVSMEFPYFHHLAEYQVAICKECQYAVWPDQIEGHLQEQHKIKRKDASRVGLEVRSWVSVMQYPSEFVAPSQVVAPHPQLPVYTDGLLCQLNPS